MAGTIFLVVITIVMAVSAVYNALLCFIFIKSPSYVNKTDIYIASVCAADFLLIVLGLPMTITYEMLYKTIENRLAYCQMLLYLDSSLCYITVFTLLARTLDVCFYVKQVFTFFVVNILREQVESVVIIIWLSGFVLAGLPMIGLEDPNRKTPMGFEFNNCVLRADTLFGSCLFSVIFVFCLLFCSTIYCNVFIQAYRIHKARKTLPGSKLNTSEEKKGLKTILEVSVMELPDRGLFTMKDYLRGLYTMGIKLMLIYVGWSPYLVQKIYHSVTGETIPNKAVLFLSEFSPFLSSLINPLLYGLLNPRANDHIRKNCRRCFKPPRRFESFRRASESPETGEGQTSGASARKKPKNSVGPMAQPRGGETKSETRPLASTGQPSHGEAKIETGQPSHGEAKIETGQPSHGEAKIETGQPSHGGAKIETGQPSHGEAKIETGQPSHDEAKIETRGSLESDPRFAWSVTNREFVSQSSTPNDTQSKPSVAPGKGSSDEVPNVVAI